VTTLALIGKGVAVSGFCTIYLYASELFPTVLRGVAMGHCGFWGRVGSLLAPQLLFLVSLKLQWDVKVEGIEILSVLDMILYHW
jgi:OCT family organic cation transporter-like MFS transporter 4/5